MIIKLFKGKYLYIKVNGFFYNFDFSFCKIIIIILGEVLKFRIFLNYGKFEFVINIKV